jgi:hypothetical protein
MFNKLNTLLSVVSYNNIISIQKLLGTLVAKAVRETAFRKRSIETNWLIQVKSEKKRFHKVLLKVFFKSLK